MKQTIPLLALVAALHAASPAWAHTEAHKQATGAQTPPAAAASGAAATTAPAPQDARSYFTDLELFTQDGRKVRFYSDMLEGRTVVINVIYTNCQDACPLITQQLNEVRQRMPELFGKQVFFTCGAALGALQQGLDAGRFGHRVTTDVQRMNDRGKVSAPTLD